MIKNKRPKLYRIVIIFYLLFFLLLGAYIYLTQFNNVLVSTFDVIVSGNTFEISESKKTFKIYDYKGDLIKTSKEYN